MHAAIRIADVAVREDETHLQDASHSSTTIGLTMRFDSLSGQDMLAGLRSRWSFRGRPRSGPDTSTQDIWIRPKIDDLEGLLIQ